MTKKNGKMLLNVERKSVGRMRNKEVENVIDNICLVARQCRSGKTVVAESIKTLTDYIDKLERENFGLKIQVAHFREKEEKRYREAGWRQ